MNILMNKNASSNIKVVITVVISVVIGALLFVGILFLVNNVFPTGIQQAIEDGNVDLYQQEKQSETTSTSSSVVVYEFMRGDVDGDRIITEKDKIAISRYLAGYSGYEETKEMDVNADGTVNANDINALQDFLSGKTASLPA